MNENSIDPHEPQQQMNDLSEKITEYLSVGGLVNPELMPHDKVRDLLIDCRKELDRLQEKCNQQAMFLKRLNPERFPDTFFVSGESGTRDKNGLPEYVHVVPAYGVDWFMMYKRTEKSWGPQW